MQSINMTPTRNDNDNIVRKDAGFRRTVSMGSVGINDSANNNANERRSSDATVLSDHNSNDKQGDVDIDAATNAAANAPIPHPPLGANTPPSAPPPNRSNPRTLSEPFTSTFDDVTTGSSVSSHAMQPNSFLSQALREVTSLGKGIALVEMWVMNDEGTHLIRVQDGWAANPGFLHTGNADIADARASLIHKDHAGHIEAAPLAPGCGLTGALWTEAPSTNDQLSFPMGLVRKRSAVRPPHGGGTSGDNSGQKRSKLRLSISDRRQLFEGTKGKELFGFWSDRDVGSSSRQLKRDDSRELDQSTFSRTRRLLSPLTSQLNLTNLQGRPFSSRHQHAHSEDNPLQWREVVPLANDPDQPYDERLQLIAACGLKWAVAVPFQTVISKLYGFEHHQHDMKEGVVVYMVEDGIDLDAISTTVHETYLRHMTKFIASAYSLELPREEMIKELDIEDCESMHECCLSSEALHTSMNTAANNSDNQASVGCVEPNMHLAPGSPKVGQQRKRKAIHGKQQLRHHRYQSRPHIGLNQSHHGPQDGCEYDNESIMTSNRAKRIRKALLANLKKSMGANTKAPPASNWDQALKIFVSVFLTLSILTNISEGFEDLLGRDYRMVLGPMGALMTLQYGLTAAPASQPPNIIVGQLLSLLIGQGISRCDGFIDPWLRQSLATALAIGAMVKFGITHPPAGATALIFSARRFAWGQIGMTLLASVVAIVCSTFFNNLQKKRQYPTYWGFRYISKMWTRGIEHAERFLWPCIAIFCCCCGARWFGSCCRRTQHDGHDGADKHGVYDDEEYNRKGHQPGAAKEGPKEHCIDGTVLRAIKTKARSSDMIVVERGEEISSRQVSI